MSKLRLFTQFEAMAKLTLVYERLAGMRSSYRASDLIPALDRLMDDLDRIEAAMATTREGN